MSSVLSKVNSVSTVSNADVWTLCSEFVEREDLASKRVLAVIPDHTRTAPIDLLFRTLYGLLAAKPGRLDFLIALGTHPPMNETAIDRRLGLAPGERAARYPNIRVFNHHWNDPRSLETVGTLSAERVTELSGGLIHHPVNVSVNRMIFDYDLVLIVGPTFPHEVVGFSGGNKYFFPGISGEEILNMFHWLGALITNPAIIGVKHTPVRAVVDAAAELLAIPKQCVSLVVGSSGLVGVYCGTPEEAWSAAADHSSRVHIIRKERPFRRVLSCAPEMYDELWTAGKAAYKLEPVVATDGELIVYAPHLKEISRTHGKHIRRIGYHVRDYFTKQMHRFADVPKGVIAHSTHVKGIGTFENNVEKPRIRVTLASGISAEVCKSINLGYENPATIRPEDWVNREDEGILYVSKAGETLYRLTNDPFLKA